MHTFFILSDLDTNVEERYAVTVDDVNDPMSSKTCFSYTGRPLSGPGARYNVAGTCTTTPFTGRYVTVRRLGGPGSVTLCDIQVVGEYLGKITCVSLLVA